MMAYAPNANTADSCTEQVECVTFAESVAMSEEELMRWPKDLSTRRPYILMRLSMI
jgi:hypothetical protein